ncbi:MULTISPECIES: hypothetical protein [Candidatus Kuenenia]|nr:hypothetical protein [Candidatus Kuenenia stuttgartiensis]
MKHDDWWLILSTQGYPLVIARVFFGLSLRGLFPKQSHKQS